MVIRNERSAQCFPVNSLIFLAINEFEWVVIGPKAADDSNNPFCGGGGGLGTRDYSATVSVPAIPTN